MEQKNIQKCHSLLLAWYQKERRPLPWRAHKDPYKIWISEIMLQQTTVAAVIPFYEKFLKRFPTVEMLASSPLEDVIEHWAGLGYYSRARNLHKAAQLFSETGFPESAEKLIEYPGLGPYTSRAISSIAFDEKVGVLDGNVIRVLSRVSDEHVKWWTTAGRNQLQSYSDALALLGESSHLNQALMELGATVCTPKSPVCGLCPWISVCKANKNKTVEILPLKKPKRATEIWIWNVEIYQKKNEIGVLENTYLPFLKKTLLPPGRAKKVNTKPAKYDFKHSITHHDIFVKVDVMAKKSRSELKFMNQSKLKKVNPTSVIAKIFEHLEL
jgi:A/G-specific adenine glycosylase